MLNSAPHRKGEIIRDQRLSLIIWLLKVTGLWSRHDFKSHWKNILYRCYSCFMYFGGFLNFALMFLYVILSAETLEDFTETLNVCISQTVFAVKLFPFVFRNHKLENIISALENNFYIHGSEHSPHEIQVPKTALANATLLIFIYCGLIYSTSLVMIFTPLTIELASDKSQGNGTTARDRSFTFLMWYPFDVAETRYYAIAYTQQAICSAIEGLSIVPIPGLFYSLLIFYTTAQFELLGVSLRNATECVTTRLKKKRFTATDGRNAEEYLNLQPPDCRLSSCNGEDNKKEPDIDEVDAVQDNTIVKQTNVPEILFPQEEIDNEMRIFLTECISHHQFLLDYVCELNSLLSPIFFWEFTTGALVICMLGFHLMTIQPNSVQFAKVVLHLSCILSMMAFTSFFGSNLEFWSTEVHNAAYECEWYDQSPHFKNLLKMIIMRAQKPVTIDAGYFGSISLPMFASVMQTSYSYMAVLRTIQEG